MKINGPFVKLIMFNGGPTQLYRSFVEIKTQNQMIQWFNIDFSASILIIKNNLPRLTFH